MLQLILILLLVYIASSVPFYKIFVKAHENGWLAFVPIYSTLILLKILQKPKWWLLYSFIPFINTLLSIVLMVETVKGFGKFKFWQHFVAVIFPFNVVYLAYLGFSNEEKWRGPDYAEVNFKRSTAREWIDAIVFALVAATVIRSFMIEAYTIPTSSMEETLLVDDFLFVSKMNWGPRVPMTPVAFPLAHNTMPFIGGNSYLDWPSIPYFRLPGWQKINNYDIVVFNWPADKDRPVDKKENYIKRCIAIPGDSIKMVKTEVFINNKAMPFPEHYQSSYHIVTDGTQFENDPKLCDKLGIRHHPKVGDLLELRGVEPDQPRKGQVDYADVLLTKQAAAEIKALPFVKLIEENIEVAIPSHEYALFPHDSRLNWARDNFSSFYVPKKGANMPVTIRNFRIYKWAIEYETGGKLDTANSQVTLDGKVLSTYTFKLDYYFMMGDNRHNSSDGRYWGFVPEDHIVGKPVMIWFSIDGDAKGFFNKIRWNRMFSMIGNK